MSVKVHKGAGLSLIPKSEEEEGGVRIVAREILDTGLPIYLHIKLLGLHTRGAFMVFISS